MERDQVESAEELSPSEDEAAPSWLQGLDGTLPAELEDAASQVPTETEDTSDWLADLRSSPSERAKDAEVAPPILEEEGSAATSEGDMPDWLAELQPAGFEEPAPEADEASSVKGDISPIEDEGGASDWLVELQSLGGDEPAPTEFAPVVEEASTATGEDDVPDWLTELQPGGGGEPAPEELEAAGIEDGVPDWLAELQPAGIDEPAPAEFVPVVEEVSPGPDDASPVPGEGDVPDWLAELQIEGGNEPAPAELEPSAIEGDVPDWLSELQPAGADEPPPAEFVPVVDDASPGPGEGDVPDWLGELQTEGGDEPLSTEPAPLAEKASPMTDDALPMTDDALPMTDDASPVTGEGDVPDWLVELQPSDMVEPAPDTAMPPAEKGDMPEWLVGLQPTPLGEEPSLETEPDSTLDALPAALAGVGLAALALDSDDAQEESPGQQVEEVPSDLGPAEGEVEDKAVPTWLAEMSPAAEDEADTSEGSAVGEEPPDWLVPAEAELAEDGSLERAEIPSWLLALKPQELRQEDEEEAEPPAPDPDALVEDTGLLAGIPGTLPVEMLIAQPRAAAPAADEIVLPTESAGSRLFAEIVARPPSVTAAEIAQRRPDSLARVPRLLIYLALIVAVTIPLVLGGSLIPRSIETNDALLGLYSTIQELPAGARVLVAFDYDPATSGEMGVIAQAIVGHLAEQDAQIVGMSLLPAGPATAQSLLENMVAGEQYANLGYLPGQATAVRLMSRSMVLAFPRDYQGRPLSEVEIMDGISTLADFDLIIELAATQNSLRWWIEQRDMDNENPLAAGVSASVEPLARPYFETNPRQLSGLIGGVPGAAMYESQYRGLDSLPQPLSARLDAQLAGHIVLILVLLIGNVVYLFRRRSGEEQ